MRILPYIACAAAFGPLWWVVVAAWPTTGGSGAAPRLMFRGSGQTLLVLAFAATSVIVALGGRRHLARDGWGRLLLVALVACGAGMLLQPVVFLTLQLAADLLDDPAAAMREWVSPTSGPFGSTPTLLDLPLTVLMLSGCGLAFGLTTLPITYPVALVEVALLRWIGGRSRRSGVVGAPAPGIEAALGAPTPRP